MSIKTLYKRHRQDPGPGFSRFDGVDKRCDVLATAIRAVMTAKDLTELELCYAPPFGSAKDPVNFVGYVIENTLAGRVKNFFWDDVAKLPRDGSVTLLDVRTDLERENGRYIDGFIHIPVDELRERVGELDESKPVHPLPHWPAQLCGLLYAGWPGLRLLQPLGRLAAVRVHPQQDQVPGAQLLRPQLSFPALL